MSSVTFFTQCYEGDWESIILNGGIQRKLENLNYEFTKKILIITNVNNREIVEESSKHLKENNVIDYYYFTDDYSDKVLEYFDIDKNTFNGGYWYSIAPLLSIYLCETEYLMYLTGDSLVEQKEYDWISRGVEMMLSNPKIKSVNPIWNHDFNNAEQQENELHNNKFEKNSEWWYGQGFSDQCFLIKTETFKDKIYNNHNELSDIHYPKYAGESFEKRVYAFLLNQNYYRITNKQITYFHPRWY
jgi:hypothetical protein